ncbi:hypothetical protein [uncultured Rhodoblastus sp.]|uniref:hypothetical protein n=1 Tax=uncultured Rhodoblastus sp. TaxID=543037 RepID=UPI0025E0FB79|nr:hypothetical protein [uncultured Rhodoblastus sp.]
MRRRNRLRRGRRRSGLRRGEIERFLQDSADFFDRTIERHEGAIFRNLKQTLTHVFAQGAHRIQNIVGHRRQISC